MRKTHNNKDMDIIIGGTVRAARNERRLTQEQLAGALQMDRCTVTHIENGTRALSVSEVWMVAFALRMSASVFFERLERARRAVERARRAAGRGTEP